MMVLLQVLSLVCLVGLALSQQACPNDLGWYMYWDTCYRLEAFPERTKSSAENICSQDGAYLVSIENQFENEFITDWLLNNDINRKQWLTSGVTTATDAIKWTGDSTSTTFNFFNENVDASKNKSGSPIIYSYTGTEYGWSIGDIQQEYGFICEIKLTDVYRIVQEYRGFDYGIMGIENPRDAPRGPVFIQQPVDTIVLGSVDHLNFECLADGNPEPSYEWWMERSGNWVPVPLTDSHFTVSTGKLDIENPETINVNRFQCKASNSEGTSLSNFATLSFGEIDEFTNNRPAPVIADEYRGQTITCPDIIANPGLTYNWYKNSLTNFIRPRYQAHTFLSTNGKLYFSEVEQADAGDYHCMVDLYGYGFGSRVISYASESRTSRGTELRVKSGGGSNQPVNIQSEFPSVFPSNPIKGGDVRLECFAYGTGPLLYSWSRPDKPLPKGHKYDSHNRVLYLTQLELQDGGIYKCNVRSLTTNQEQSKDMNLIIQARPYFTYPLRHMHLDVDARLIWYCEASASPNPTYRWYKDGKVLTSDSSKGITVNRNTLTIGKVNAKRDNGMYQCASTNLYGTTFSTAQLRVLELAPTFERNPMTKSMYAASQGHVTIWCSPMAAPTPNYKWLKDGADLNLVAGDSQDDSAHYSLLRNGNLIIHKIQQGDQGRYTCVVENSVGQAQDYTDLSVLQGSVISNSPVNEKVEVNLTETLVCQATHAPDIDMVYEWRFNDHVIDYYLEPEYRQGQGNMEGSLHIVAAQFSHEGEYTCTAITPMDKMSKSAYLEVLGPPSAPAGVIVRQVSQLPAGASDLVSSNVPINTDTTRWVMWTDGAIHGGDITNYFVEFQTKINMEWRVHPDANNIPVYKVTMEQFKNQRFARLTNLKAYANIRFRVRARNSYGIGAPSSPTEYVRIVGAKPSATVNNLRGGGGSVGDLTIVWDALPEEDENGPDLRYVVNYRLYDPSNIKAQWHKVNVTKREACKNEMNYRIGEIYGCDYVAFVKVENFYKKYEVRVSAANVYGDGPFTETKIIMSAETLPLGVPTKVFGHWYNGTALDIEWKPVPNTRESAGGQLRGYKINYWVKDVEDETQAMQNIIELKPGQTNLDHALIIGLEPMIWYKFTVQAYNSAGNGDKSSSNERQTLNKAPGNYPTEVHVFSVEGFGVRVSFRGISTQYREEPLKGYLVQYWKANENMLSAEEANFGLMTTGVIRNLSSSEIYELRVQGYSRGGYGERSNPAIYFTVGDGQIVVNPETTEIISGTSVLTSSLLSFLSVCVVFVLMQNRL